MKHSAPREFWEAYNRLPQSVQKLADKNFELLKQDPAHPSLNLKKIGRLRSARVGIHYRALAVEGWRRPYLVLDRSSRRV